ncbi:MAG: site-2 protease family protein [Clostridiaceae bacterium]|jgi:Zn-dependent protease|nr:site-2 protease family protein [Eubacteriales bacterium]NLV47782.1 site-2 protease family protein [Clostridiaceae bacterium]
MPILTLSGLLSGFSFENVQYYLLMFLVLCVSLSIHEAAHGWVAWRLGDDTAALQGRLTLNPLKHLDPIGSLAFLIAGIGWARPVPINPARFDRKHSIKKGIMLTSLAGPGSNLILSAIAAFLFFVVLTITGLVRVQADHFLINILTQLFYLMYFYNIILAVFNLLPIPPLDGFKIFGSLLPDQIYFKLMRVERYIGLVFLVLVLFGRGMLSRVLQTIRMPFDWLIWQPIEFIFTALWRTLGIG